MAGDWIKMRTDLYRNPKVCMIADILLDGDGELARYVSQNMQRDMAITRNVMRNVTVGALVAVWGVLRHRGKRDGDDLIVSKCSKSVIDDLSEIPGFGHAMEFVGWVEEYDEYFVLPRFFTEMNIDPAEEMRAKNAERQRRFREKQKKKSDVTGDVTVTLKSNYREEKRREENIKHRGDKRPVFTPPELSEVSAYCHERGKGVDPEKWHNFYAAKGWMVGKNKMRDWRAAVRTWEGNSKSEEWVNT